MCHHTILSCTNYLWPPVVRLDLSLFVYCTVIVLAEHSSYIVEETVIVNRKIFCIIIILYYALQYQTGINRPS